jgi:hypothetical protein
MMLRRPSMVRATRDDADTQNLAIVDVAKHRNGEIGDVKMAFYRDFTRFGDRSQKDETAEAEEIQRRMDEDRPMMPEMHQDEIIIDNLI